MKILGLLNSNVYGGDGNIPQQDLFPSRMAPIMAERIGEPVSVATRAVWPTPTLPAAVARWMAAEDPDLVIFSVQSYWFLYESIPARLQRQFGAPGRVVGSWGLKAAATPWLAHNAGFRWSRDRFQRMFPGRPHFEPGEVIDVARRAISVMVRDEGAYVAVTGPGGGYEWAADDRVRVEHERRRRQVDEALAEFCRSLHVEYWPARAARPATAERSSLQRDGLHLDAEGHRQHASRHLEVAVELCRRAQAHMAASAGVRS